MHVRHQRGWCRERFGGRLSSAEEGSVGPTAACDLLPGHEGRSGFHAVARASCPWSRQGRGGEGLLWCFLSPHGSKLSVSVTEEVPIRSASPSFPVCLGGGRAPLLGSLPAVHEGCGTPSSGPPFRVSGGAHHAVTPDSRSRGREPPRVRRCHGAASAVTRG